METSDWIPYSLTETKLAVTDLLSQSQFIVVISNTATAFTGSGCFWISSY